MRDKNDIHIYIHIHIHIHIVDPVSFSVGVPLFLRLVCVYLVALFSSSSSSSAFLYDAMRAAHLSITNFYFWCKYLFLVFELSFLISRFWLFSSFSLLLFEIVMRLTDGMLAINNAEKETEMKDKVRMKTITLCSDGHLTRVDRPIFSSRVSCAVLASFRAVGLCHDIRLTPPCSP